MDSDSGLRPDTRLLTRIHTHIHTLALTPTRMVTAPTRTINRTFTRTSDIGAATGAVGDAAITAGMDIADIPATVATPVTDAAMRVTGAGTQATAEPTQDPGVGTAAMADAPATQVGVALVAALADFRAAAMAADDAKPTFISKRLTGSRADEAKEPFLFPDPARTITAIRTATAYLSI